MPRVGAPGSGGTSMYGWIPGGGTPNQGGLLGGGGVTMGPGAGGTSPGLSPSYPGSQLGPLTRQAFRGTDPAAMLRGELPAQGAGAPAASAGGAPVGAGGDYPGQGAAGSNEPRPSTPPRFSGRMDSLSRGSMFRSDNGSEQAPGLPAGLAPAGQVAPGSRQPYGRGLAGPLPPMAGMERMPQIGAAPPPAAPPVSPPAPPAPAPAPPSAPAGPPRMQALLTESPQQTQEPVGAPVAPGQAPASTTAAAPASVPAAPSTSPAVPQKTEQATTTYLDSSGNAYAGKTYTPFSSGEFYDAPKPAAFANWSLSHRNSWRAAHQLTAAPSGSTNPTTDPNAGNVPGSIPVDTRTPDQPPPDPGVRTDPVLNPDRYNQYLQQKPWTTDSRDFVGKFGDKPAAFDSWDASHQDAWRASHYRGADIPADNTGGGQNGVPDTNTPDTTYGNSFDWTHGDAPPDSRTYWPGFTPGANFPQFPPYTYNAQTGTGAFTNDGKPITITSPAFSIEDMLKIPAGRPGYQAVLRLLGSAQTASQTLAEADKETDLDRRTDLIAKASQQLQQDSAGLERYGIFYRPFAQDSTLHPNDDPYGQLPTNFDSGLVADRGLKASFGQVSQWGVPAAAMGSVMELMQKRQEAELSLANKNRAYSLQKDNLAQIQNDPARARRAGIANDIADNPDPMGAAGNELLRGQASEQYDKSLEDSNAGLARTAASRGLDPMTFAGTSYAGGMENRRQLSNQLGKLDVEASLRKRTGQQDALNALRGTLQDNGVEQSQRSDMARLLIDQGLLGQNAYSGLSDYSTGFKAYQQGDPLQKQAQDTADQRTKNGEIAGGGAIAAALIAALV